MLKRRPSLEEDGWELESALERQQKSPNTFEIPNDEERSHLQPGDFVKLIFLFVLPGEDEQHPYIQCERMWVTVEQVTETGYVGVLESLPATSDVLKPGDLIMFEPADVASIWIKKTDPRHPNYPEHA